MKVMTEAVFEAEKNSKFLREMYFHKMLHLRVAVASSTNIFFLTKGRSWSK